VIEIVSNSCCRTVAGRCSDAIVGAYTCDTYPGPSNSHTVDTGSPNAANTDTRPTDSAEPFTGTTTSDSQTATDTDIATPDPERTRAMHTFVGGHPQKIVELTSRSRREAIAADAFGTSPGTFAHTPWATCHAPTHSTLHATTASHAATHTSHATTHTSHANTHTSHATAHAALHTSAAATHTATHTSAAATHTTTHAAAHTSTATAEPAAPRVRKGNAQHRIHQQNRHKKFPNHRYSPQDNSVLEVRTISDLLGRV
jgi:hypothetical protein